MIPSITQINNVIFDGIKKQAFPINFLKPNVEQYIYHMTWYRENVYDDNTGKNWYGLRERKNAFKLFLEVCGIPKEFFSYRLPAHYELVPIEFPNPDVANKFTTYKYYNDKEIDWFLQFAHQYNFIVGPRAPSEMAIMKIGDIDWDNCTIKFSQPKLRGKKRKIMLPESFINGGARKSLKNFVEYHRYENQYSEDYLFTSPWTGKPYWDDKNRKLAVTRSGGLGKLLNQTGKMVYPLFFPY